MPIPRVARIDEITRLVDFSDFTFRKPGQTLKGEITITCYGISKRLEDES
ncbi:hypothetical protein PAECIP111891_07006 [Paenibacillus allorhizoplanae]|uniref:Uncharacterized protein n=1 Tax=Paenibacillus allorhizoplanae TaxID=2905648 RepID=A0ABM9D1C2_9BACL|nr:hypothetical protein PAECIP111891_07006 [Paenibacillus allorhizoplanae]